ncbi:hypothetical protein FM106_14750 [Brachybacterium faecium]|nr:hypothetical protein FM106_14750 [Brachybacterium faecium]
MIILIFIPLFYLIDCCFNSNISLLLVFLMFIYKRDTYA